MVQALQLLRHAARAMREEVMDFRFEYPLEIVPNAGPKQSLEYYLYSDRLSWGVMRLDSAGIPRVWGRVTGPVYRPGFIAWWGLVNLGHYLRHRDQVSRDVFLNQLNCRNHCSHLQRKLKRVTTKTLVRPRFEISSEQKQLNSCVTRHFDFTQKHVTTRGNVGSSSRILNSNLDATTTGSSFLSTKY